MWGCVKDSQLYDGTDVEEYNGEKYVYWNCPRKFIPSSIFTFMALYNYYEAHPSAQFPTLDKVSARYYLAEIYYKTQLSENLSHIKGGDQ